MPELTAKQILQLKTSGMTSQAVAEQLNIGRNLAVTLMVAAGAKRAKHGTSFYVIVCNRAKE